MCERRIDRDNLFEARATFRELGKWGEASGFWLDIALWEVVGALNRSAGYANVLMKKG